MPLIGTSLLIASGADVFTLTKEANVDQSISIIISLPAGREFVINWGDDSSSTVTGPQIVTVYTHAYSDTNEYTITFTGDWKYITYYDMNTEPISGNAEQFRKMTGLTRLRFNTCTNMNGNISALSTLTSLTYLRIYSTSVTGDIASLSTLTSLTYLHLGGTSIDTYTQGTLPNWDNCSITINSLGLSQQEVDDFLVDLNTSSTASTKTIDISGTNAVPSATGLAAKTALEGKGWTVIVST